MLHATERKSRFYRRYLGHREDDEKRVAEEDEITSTVFGPLDFVSQADAYSFWLDLLSDAVGPQGFLPRELPESISHQFWPRRSAIEPDLLVTMQWRSEKKFLLVEVKWRAPLSGDDQLRKQWQRFLSSEERDSAIHLFIAPETSAGSAEISAHGDIWGGRLVLVPWLHVRRSLGRLSTGIQSGLARWASAANEFLRRIGISSFHGFRSYAHPVPQRLGNGGRPIFWRPDYFQRLPIPTGSLKPEGPIFFVGGV